MNRGKIAWMVILPGIFMMVTTVASLVILPFLYIKKHAYSLLAMDIALLLLSAGVVYIATKTFRAKWLEMKAGEAAAPAELARK
jgi:hypothetical protein